MGYIINIFKQNFKPAYLLFLSFLLSLAISTEANQQCEYIKIMAIGTSLTRYGEWLPALAKKLNKSTNQPVFYINHGFPGKNVKYGLNQLDKLLKTKANIFLIEFSINDSDLFKGVTLSESRDLTAKIIQGIKAKYPNALIILMKMNPVFGLRKLAKPRLQQFYNLYDELSLSNKVDVLDFYNIWQKKTRKDLKMNIPDGIHPTPKAVIEVMVPLFLSRLFNDSCIYPTFRSSS